MANNNEVRLCGFVITPPKKKEDSDRNICTFFLETSKTWVEKGAGDSGKVGKERFEQHCIVALDRTCENIMTHAKVGSEITVFGELTYSRYVDSGDIERVRAEVVLNSFHVHGLRKYKYEESNLPADDMPWAGDREAKP